MPAIKHKIESGESVKVGYVWIDDKKTHGGLVSKVAKGNIEIQHASSGQGKVTKNDWKK